MLEEYLKILFSALIWPVLRCLVPAIIIFVVAYCLGYFVDANKKK